mgnify:CR=1 FL=1
MAAKRSELVENDEIFRRGFAVLAGDEFKLDLLTFVESRQSGAFNGRNVNKRIPGAIAWFDKAITLGGVEPFYCTSSHIKSFFP